MPRLTNPASGTVVRCEGDLAAHLVRQGWAEAETASAQPLEAAPDKPRSPARKPGRPRKTT